MTNPYGSGIGEPILPLARNDETLAAVDAREKGMRPYLLLAAALTFSVLTMGCEGDLPLRMVQRDVDSMRSEVAAVARTGEGTRMFIEERLRKVEDRLEKSERTRAALEGKLGKLDSDLKSQAAKVAQERQERQGVLQSQAALTVKLDELTTEVRLAQGQTEGIGHGITEINRRVDESGRQIEQFGRRLNGLDKQVNQSVVASQEATTVAQQAVAASQQTAKQVTAALGQMAQQANAAIEQVNTTAQLALTEARKTTKGKPITGSVDLPRAGTQPMPPAVAPIMAPPLVPSAPATQAPTQGAVPPPPAAQKVESPAPPASAARSMASPQSAEELYSHALSDYTKGNYESAINGFRRIVELYPNSRRLPNARYWLGESYYSQKNYDQAITEFELLIKQFPKSQEAKRAKGRLSQVR